MAILSPYIIAVISAWLVAQGAKYIIDAVKQGDVRNVRTLYLSGSMPSAHSASVTALLVVIALRDGIDSGLFGLAALFAAIVMYDAMMVRRSSGEQGAALTELIKKTEKGVTLPRVARGHTPVEVAVGVLLGGGIGLVVFLATQ